MPGTSDWAHPLIFMCSASRPHLQPAFGQAISRLHAKAPEGLKIASAHCILGALRKHCGRQKLLGFVVFLWLAKVLPLGEYAQFGLLYALQQALTTLGSAGVVEALVGESKAHPRPSERAHLVATANLAFLFLVLPCAGFALLGWNLPSLHIAFDSLSYHGR